MEGHEDGDDSQRGMIARAVEQVFACSSQLVDKGWQVSGEEGEEGEVDGVQGSGQPTLQWYFLPSKCDANCWDRPVSVGVVVTVRNVLGFALEPL